MKEVKEVKWFMIGIIFIYTVAAYAYLHEPMNKGTIIPLQKDTDLNQVINQQVRLWMQSIKGFEPNLGQVGDFEGKKVKDVLFIVKEKGFSIFFKKEGVSYVIYKAEGNSKSKLFNQEQDIENTKLNYARIDVDLLNANIKKSKIIYEEPLPGYSNYYLAHCPEGALNVRRYRKVIVKDVYPGIDWIFRYDDKGQLHHEFEVSAGADVNQIKFKIKWANVEISKDGRQLMLSTPIGKIADGQIISYEGLKQVEVRYKMNEGVVGYYVKNWSGKDKLYIDPPLALRWATYYGGNSEDVGLSITTDLNYNVLVTGHTSSSNFPVYNPANGAYFQGTISAPSDAFILKFSNTGVQLWATYYGGNDSDIGSSIDTDSSDNVFVCGETLSSNFPTYDPGGSAYFQGTNAGMVDAFILKFSNTGVRLWATYYGGSSDDRDCFIAADVSGNVFATGYTASGDFPTYDPGGGAYFQGTPGMVDAYILKFSNTGVRLWATYYGGSHVDYGQSITADASGNVFATGYTFSADFPTYNPGGSAYFQGTLSGWFDAYILKFSNTGVRFWATYYGGSNDDYGQSITADASGNVFATGYTVSANFPTYNPGGSAYFQGTNAGWDDAFILKFSNTGVRLWATYYGGSNDDYGQSITADASGNVFATGYTVSADFPTYNPGGGAYFQGINAGWDDAFILKFSNTGVRLWATYYGGSNYDEGDYITTDLAGNIFLTGKTGSTNFPVYNPGGGSYFQGAIAGDYDAFMLKFQTSIIQNPAEAGPMLCQKNANSSITCTYTNGGSCATDNVIYYGLLSAVSQYGYVGAICKVGTSGTVTFSLAAGDWFWVIVSNNGLYEGSYGKDSSGIERPEAILMPCDFPQDLTNTCLIP